MRRIDGETARESLLAVAPQGRGIDPRAGAVAAFEPDGALEPLVVAVERIDEVPERKLVVARLNVEREAQPRRVGQRPHADQRVGEDRPGEGPAGHVVDRVEHGDFAVVKLALAFEHLDGALDDVAQAGALALREVADGVVNVVGRITVTGEDRLVDAQRIGFDIPVADIGVGEERIVENLRQLVVGDDFVAGAGGEKHREEGESRYTEVSFHIIRCFSTYCAP